MNTTDRKITIKRIVSMLILGWIMLIPVWLVAWSNNKLNSFTDYLLFYTPIILAILMIGITLHTVIKIKEVR